MQLLPRPLAASPPKNMTICRQRMKELKRVSERESQREMENDRVNCHKTKRRIENILLLT